MDQIFEEKNTTIITNEINNIDKEKKISSSLNEISLLNNNHYAEKKLYNMEECKDNINTLLGPWKKNIENKNDDDKENKKEYVPINPDIERKSDLYLKIQNCKLEIGKKEKIDDIQNIINLISDNSDDELEKKQGVNITEENLQKYMEGIRFIFGRGKVFIKYAHEKLAIALNKYRKLKSDIVKETEFIHWLYQEKPLFFHYGMIDNDTKTPSYSYFKNEYSHHKHYFLIIIVYTGFKFNNIPWHDVVTNSIPKIKWILDDLRKRGEMDSGKPLAFLLEKYDQMNIQSLLLNINNHNNTKSIDSYYTAIVDKKDVAISTTHDNENINIDGNEDENIIYILLKYIINTNNEAHGMKDYKRRKKN